jgi:AGCS family alanine or glycine:cation symporter
LWGIRIKIPYRWVFCGIIFVGAVLKVEVAWSIGDVFNGMMTLSNLIGLLGLTGVAITAIKTYLKDLDKHRYKI